MLERVFIPSNKEKYSWVANRRGTSIDFSNFFLTPWSLLRPPSHWFSRTKFLSRAFSLLIFLRLSKQKSLFDTYLMHFCLILFIYWPYFSYNSSISGHHFPRLLRSLVYWILKELLIPPIYQDPRPLANQECVVCSSLRKTLYHNLYH